MSPDDIHKIVDAIIRAMDILVPALVGYLASHYGNKQGAANATAAVEVPKA